MNRALLIRLGLALLASLFLGAGCLRSSEAGRDKYPPPLKPVQREGGAVDREDHSDNKDRPAMDPKSLAAAQAVTPGVNAFAFDCYRQLKAEPGNLLFSPFSISMALAMTGEGARGATESEIQQVFHLPADAKQRQDGFSALYQTFNPAGRDFIIMVANGIWAQPDYHFEPAYISLLKDSYFSEATNLDFRSDPEAARGTINKWVADHTADRISELFPPNTIKNDTPLVLANALYFKGLWDLQFDPQNTSDMPFHAPDGDKQVPTMVQPAGDATFRYAESEGHWQALELPYKGKQLAMLILLPAGNDLSALDSQLEPAAFDALLAQLSPRSLPVYLPKFKFLSKHDMGDTLSAMGMPTAFLDTADFSGMTGKRDLKIGVVVHQAFVEVNEEGTEAAAATGVAMAPTGAAMNPLVFRADHPFLFLIRDTQSGAILFMGRVEDPTAQ